MTSPEWGHAMGNRWLAAAGIAAIALVAAACGSSTSNGSGGGSGSTPSSSPAAASSPASSSGSALQERTIGGKKVLTTAKGFTVYWFAIDTMTKSKCNGSCSHYWPPVKGPVTAGHGVTGKLGTIKRDDGTLQATYNGHPLYTYVGDTAPGQNKGNGLNISGGLWYEVTVTGSAAPAPSPSQSSSGGGGYGY
jgi:predicted lipoprotein with Yx(FWY)xxD motif